MRRAWEQINVADTDENDARVMFGIADANQMFSFIVNIQKAYVAHKKYTIITPQLPSILEALYRRSNWLYEVPANSVAIVI